MSSTLFVLGVAHYFAVLSDGPALVQLNDVFVPL